MDPEYRKAGKLKNHRFATSFHPAGFGIIETIEQQILVHKLNILEEDPLIETERYKLNVC